MNEQFLNEILNQVSVSGYEEPVQEVVKTYMEHTADEIREDEMGNLICILNPESERRIMLSAHADEIGVMVSNITENGRLQVVDRGGIIAGTYPGQQIKVHMPDQDVYGVVEGRRELFKNSELKATDFLIDIGANSREEALEKVALGAPVVPDTHIRSMMNGRFTGRALDDRLGVFVIMEALKRAKEKGCKAGVNPAETETVELGKGPVLCNSPIVVKKLNQKMEACAQKAGIPVQREAASRLTCTDGDKIHFSNEGVPMVLVSIPLRYMHTPAEVADEKDVEGCIELIAEFLTEME